MVVLAYPRAAARPPELHNISFTYHAYVGLNGAWIGRCTCGWEHIGDKLEVELRASVHDMQPGNAA